MSSSDELAALDYELPPQLIAQQPAAERDAARLLVLERKSGKLEHAHVRDLPRWLHAGDLLVLNTTRVLPARLRGHKQSGGVAEALLLGALPEQPGHYRAWLRSSGRKRVGLKLRFQELDAEVVAVDDEAVTLAFSADCSPYQVGEPPLPPYIERSESEAHDVERYQTVYAQAPGSAAAPTAGLHFTQRLLDELSENGIDRAELLLHVGPGTFKPLREKDLTAGYLHAEHYELPEACADAVARTRERGGRVVAVGTTSTRVLESCADGSGHVRNAQGETDLFLRPGSSFCVVDALLTNFHLPGSSLLALVDAFAGRELRRMAYQAAIEAEYRFYSYGDAMLIL